MAVARDRDAAGRARSSRPRDGLGRPLPYGSQGEPTTPDDLVVADADAVSMAQDLLDAGRPFHAHEVLESRWKACSDAQQRPLWQGLAQLAVGLTHEARGNRTGAERLIERGRGRLAGCSHRAVDVAGVLAWADGWLAGERGRPLRIAAQQSGPDPRAP